MTVSVRIPTILRKFTGGEKQVEGSGGTLAELFSDLDARHPGLRGGLVDESGALRRFVNVYVNDEDVRFLGAVDATLSDGDVVEILPAVAGGSGAASARTGLLRDAERAPRCVVLVARSTTTRSSSALRGIALDAARDGRRTDAAP